MNEIYPSFDFYIQPSKSENFGHSIFEAFNYGVPVIISDQTPWLDLESRKAGWDVDLEDPGALSSAIEKALGLSDEEYREWQSGARKVAEEYMANNDFRSQYQNLFK